MPITATELVNKMNIAYENLRTTILTGNSITRGKRNEIILQCNEIILTVKEQDSKFVGYTPELKERLDYLKERIQMCLPAIKHMELVN